MKRIGTVLSVAILAALSAPAGARAQAGAPANTAPLAASTAPLTAERVQLKNGAVWRFQAGQNALVNEDLRLAQNILVKTNGEFAVNGGKLRALQEGQILSADGMLTSTDGSILPVFDHVVLKDGRPRLYKDGTPGPVHQHFEAGGRHADPAGRIPG